ncbi:hypothetical protein B0H13DRAFT_1909104 [Mycena leptocephala]|nr:hypothetical protein B0H13DRAFT_1909104 [Mycena leptocephala]
MRYLDLPENIARVQVSNEKLNVSLSVRILQQEPDSFADLLILFPNDFEKPEDFLQTLIYVNGRQDAEKMQDFLRDNKPEGIDPEIFEFYHRNIDDLRKTFIQEGLNDGTMRGVPATDALGLRTGDGLPADSASLIVDEAAHLSILHTETGALDIMRREEETSSSDSDSESEPEENDGGEGQADRDAAAATQDGSVHEDDAPPAKRRKLSKRVMSALERRDKRYLLEYIVTEGCRRIPWNKFFGNKDKRVNWLACMPGGPLNLGPRRLVARGKYNSLLRQMRPSRKLWW